MEHILPTLSSLPFCPVSFYFPSLNSLVALYILGFRIVKCRLDAKTTLNAKKVLKKWHLGLCSRDQIADIIIYIYIESGSKKPVFN